MTKNLYVGNLPYSIGEDAIRGLFEADGRTVSEVRIVKDRDTGRPKGFAFVEMDTEEHAQAAISQLNGHELEGRALNVSEAREKQPRRAY